jgi:hypothetical protein
MPRNILGRSMRHGFATLIALPLILVVTAPGCGDTPRAGSADVSASRKAAEANGTVAPFGLGSKTGDVAPTKVKAGAKEARKFLPETRKKGSR